VFKGDKLLKFCSAARFLTKIVLIATLDLRSTLDEQFGVVGVRQFRLPKRAASKNFFDAIDQRSLILHRPSDDINVSRPNKATVYLILIALRCYFVTLRLAFEKQKGSRDAADGDLTHW
jgi:hypothetical protein